MENILEIKNLSKSFGGVQAVNNVSFNVIRGELSSVIGPNGAGKTTLFNLLSGYLSPDYGTALFEGENIIGIPVPDISRRGLGRSFQRSNIFLGLSVFENVQAAVISHQKKGSILMKGANNFSEVNERAYQILDSVGLAYKAGEPSASLAHGDQKLLDIAISLSTNPKMVLLDEPTAGMSAEERFKIMNLVTTLWERMNLTLVFIEHDMDIVFSTSQKIRVLNRGKLIAEGKPEDIKSNKEVRTAYLGE